MYCEECNGNKSVRSALAFILFSIIFAFLCMCGHGLLDFLTAKKDSALETYVTGSAVVVIDAGHGGEDGGTTGVNGVFEKELNLKISDYLCQLFTGAGYNAIPTRTEDVLLYDKNSDYKGKKKILDAAARLKTATDSACDLFISIHMNSYPVQKYSGLQVYYSVNSPESRIFAQEIQKNAHAYLQPNNDREIKPAGKNIYLLDRLERPAVLVECGFLSNPEECNKLNDNVYQRQLALLIYFSSSAQLDNTANQS